MDIEIRGAPGSVTFDSNTRHLGGEVRWGPLPPLPAPPRWRLLRRRPATR